MTESRLYSFRASGPTSTLLGQTSPASVTEAERCACGHLELGHDPIARRFCTATSSAGLTRGCICEVVSPTPSR